MEKRRAYMKEYSKKYRLEHHTELLLKKKIYRDKNNEIIREKQRKYLDENRAKSYAKVREWKSENKQYMRGYLYQYYRNLDNLRVKNEFRRKHYYTISIVQKVFEDNIKEFGTLTCIYCFSPLEFGKDTIDHLVPVSRMGDNSYENMVISCRVCNSTKGAKTYEEFGNWIIDTNNKKGVYNETAI